MLAKPRLVMMLLVAALFLAACGSDPEPSDSAAGGGGSGSGKWTYVDGSGRGTTIDHRPTRIVAHGSAAAALIPLGIRPVGIYADTPIDDDLALNHLDLDGIEIVGEEWGTINIEAVAALKPDLIVAEWWPVEKAYSGLEEGTSAASQQLNDIAPIVGVSQGPSILKMIEDYEKLAVSLGADPDATETKKHRDRFVEARANFETTVKAKPDLSVLAVSPTAESFYVAVPEHSAELSDFVEWGLNLVVPDQPDEGFEYWETLSWENVGKYQADVLIIDERGYPSNLDEAKQQPTWSLLTAATADAVSVWPAYWLRNYADYATALERLTSALDTADEDLVG